MGPDSAAAVPALLEAWQRPQAFELRDIRLFVAQALRNIGPGAKEAVPVLIEALQDEDTGGRCLAVEVLGAMGTEARPAVPLLFKALNDPDPYTRVKTVESIIAVGPESFPSLMEALAENSQLRQDAMRRFWGRSFAVPGRHLSHPTPAVREFAAKRLGQMGCGAEFALPALRKAGADENAEVRRAVNEALHQMEMP